MYGDHDEGVSRPASNATDHAFCVDEILSGIKEEGLSSKAQKLKKFATSKILKQIRIKTL